MAPVELDLEKALPVDGGAGFQPSGLHLSSGRLLTVSDKHDDAVFELSMQADRAVARPFVTFQAPAGEALDLEGLTGGEDGSLLLVSEAQFRVLTIAPSGRASWSTPSLEKAGQADGLFQQRNAGLEGVARVGTQLVLAAEREPRGLLELADSGAGKLLAYRLPSAACPARVNRPDDVADLSVAGGELYALERNAHLVVRLTRFDGRFREAEYWSYAQTENDPRYRYPDRAFGLAEGLALDEEHVYIVLDNNGQARESAKDDHRALLFVFKRPH
ncbi:MAG TPA: esterase-like activity of phytase family protein [Polyangiaceae bacterium]|nr:esterase-like activity of phytase family protein [Polyangiaceae bacterium]